jgi:hypothetical protein
MKSEFDRVDFKFILMVGSAQGTESKSVGKLFHPLYNFIVESGFVCLIKALKACECGGHI